MKNLFLCSYFTGVKDIFKDFMSNDTEGKKVLFIPTANIDEETKFLVDEAKEVFKSLGMEVENLEISKLDEKTIKNKIEKANYLYIGGGNTFYLLQELRRKDALLLTVFFFSFASILLTVFVPDHFIFTLFFLTMTLYLAGRAMKREKSSMKAWQTMLLSFFAAGITFTNIAKIGLADLFVNGKKTFRIKHFFISFILPLCALFAIYSYQQQAFVEPDAKVQAKVKEKKLKKDLKFAAKYEKQHEFMKSRTGTQVANNRFFEWTDLSSSRTDAVVENLFGESLQLHQKHVLEDVNKSRPIIVRYSCVLNYIAEAIIILLFLGGIIVGRKDKFLQLCMAWFATDIALHIILGFGIIEVYIMGAHWLFIIPIAISYLFKRIKQRRVLIGARLFIAALTLALIVYNLSLIIPYMLRGFVAPH